MSDNIEMQVEKAMIAYRDEHGSLPERIFFYRDGVGEGDIEYVHSQEVSRINKKLDEMYGEVDDNLTPKMTFIIVNKRLNTRFFLEDGRSPKNPVSGTIVDNTITLPER